MHHRQIYDKANSHPPQYGNYRYGAPYGHHPNHPQPQMFNNHHQQPSDNNHSKQFAINCAQNEHESIQQQSKQNYVPVETNSRKRQKLNDGQSNVDMLVNSLREQIVSLNEQIALMRDNKKLKMEEIIGKNKRYFLAYNELKKELDVKNKEFEEYKARMDKVSKDVCDKMVEIDKLEKKIEDLKSSNNQSTHEAETKVLKMEKEQLKSQLLAAQTELQEMKSAKDDLSQIKQKYVKLQENYNGLMANRDELGNAYHSLKAENEILKKRNNELSQAMEQNKIIIERLTQSAAAKDAKLEKQNAAMDKLKKLVLDGPDPQRHTLKYGIKSEDHILRTEQVSNIREHTIKQKHESINIVCSGWEDTRVKQNLEYFVEINKQNLEYFVNPIICENDTRLDDITEIFGTENEQRLRATQKISKDAILGRLTGLECTLEEWGDVYHGTNCRAKHMMHLMEFSVQDCEGKTVIVCVDPLHAHLDDFAALYVNDYLANGANDKTLVNCCWIEVEIDGWPSFVLVTLRNIEPGEELLCDDGQEYREVMETHRRRDRVQRKMKEKFLEYIDENAGFIDSAIVIDE